MRLPLLFAVALVSCSQDVGVSQVARCDGVLQQAEETVDDAFDRDGDGYLDGSNDDCVANYPAEDLDCNDGDPDVHPQTDEVPCNDVDDDCNADTIDFIDLDADGFFADPSGQCAEANPGDVFDCDDGDALVNPGLVEVLCDELNNDCDEGTPDGLDQDADGFTECTDCKDLTPSINPGAIEVSCNNLDDDCSEVTLDSPDFDGDGTGECDDCDDTDAAIGPHAEDVCDDGDDNDCDGFVDEGCCVPEVCDDLLDNDCNGEIDEGCDYSDTWDLDETMAYSCAWGLVSMNFDKVSIEDLYPLIEVTGVGSGSVPGTMTGSFSSTTEFEVSRLIPGSCDELYTMTGTFTTADEFVGSFTAEFIGGGGCFDCADQSWFFTGTR